MWDSVHTVHDGMGSFVITPQSGYLHAEFYPSGSEKRYNVSLPYTESGGYSMISDMLSDSLLQVNIWRTQDCIGEQTALAVTCRGEVIYFKEIKDIENSQLNIDCSEWPIGVCRLTLFNKEGKILSSRSIFHTITVPGSRESYGKNQTGNKGAKKAIQEALDSRHHIGPGVL